MTFDEWVMSYFEDAGGVESEYSGNVISMADAWNAAVEECRRRQAVGEPLADAFIDDTRSAVHKLMTRD